MRDSSGDLASKIGLPPKKALYAIDDEF